MGVRVIRVYPDPVLRARCEEVETVDDDLRTLVDDMIETMHRAPGVGLAASQIGIEKRVAVVDLSVGEDSEALHVLINPEISAPTGECTEVEGCLSIPEFTEKVVRPERIEVEALGRDGRKRRFAAEGWLARAICHEVDHLDGVLFVDHLRGLRKERAKRFLRRLVKEREAVQAGAQVR